MCEQTSFFSDLFIRMRGYLLEEGSNDYLFFFSGAEVCPLCKEEFKDDEFTGDSVRLLQKGADTINESSRKRGQNDVIVRVGQRVHCSCRSYWTHPEKIERALRQSQEIVPPVERKSAPVSLGPYNSQMDCLFCRQTVVKGIHGHDEPTSEVKTCSLPETVLAICEKRVDDWAVAVKDRIQSLGSDPRPAAFVYHMECIANFRIGQDIPGEFRTEPASKQTRADQGRNKDQQLDFLRMCQYLEDIELKQLTISDLFIRMRGVTREWF